MPSPLCHLGRVHCPPPPLPVILIIIFPHRVVFPIQGKTCGDKNTGSFASAAEFQKAMWWYNGAMDTGVMSHPPLMSVASLLAHGAVEMAGLRGVFGGKPNAGTAATVVTGNATMPVLYVCGISDP